MGSSWCNVPHPKLPITCVAEARYPNHDAHFAMYEGKAYEWPNPNYVPVPPESGKWRAAEVEKAIHRRALEIKAARSGVGPTEPTFPSQPTSLTLAGHSADHQRTILLVLMATYPKGFAAEHLVERMYPSNQSARSKVANALNELEQQGWVEVRGRWLKARDFSAGRGRDVRLPIFALSHGAAEFLDATAPGENAESRDARQRWDLWKVGR